MKTRLQEKAEEKRKAQADRLRPKPAAEPAPKMPSLRSAQPAPKMPSLRSAQPVRPLTEGGQRSGRPVPPVPGTEKPTTLPKGGSEGSWFSKRKRPKYQEGGFVTF